MARMTRNGRNQILCAALTSWPWSLPLSNPQAQRPTTGVKAYKGPGHLLNGGRGSICGVADAAHKSRVGGAQLEAERTLLFNQLRTVGRTYAPSNAATVTW